MARSDLIINLVKASVQSDKVAFQKTLEAIIAEERGKQHGILADRLAQFLLESNGASKGRGTYVNGELTGNLFYEILPKKKIESLLLPAHVKKGCLELVEEHQRKDLLHSYGLEPRNRILLVGPPGNGKTSLAEALATELMLPMFTVRYEGVIGSYLGETSNRIRNLFDFIRNRQCLLFLDEFDTLGKERGDTHETGEIKRVVSSLLLQLDGLPSYVVVVTATNHPELLDRAVWRRFQLRLTLPNPTRNNLELWFSRFQTRIDEPLGISARSLAERFVGNSFGEAEEFCTNIIRRKVLEVPGGSLTRIINSELEQWKKRAKGK